MIIQNILVQKIDFLGEYKNPIKLSQTQTICKIEFFDITAIKGWPLTQVLLVLE